MSKKYTKAAVTILKILIFFSGFVVIGGIIDDIIDVPNNNPVIWRFFWELIPFALSLILTVAFLFIEKGTVKIPIKENLGKGMAVGTVTGFIWIVVSSSILIATSQFVITGKNDVPFLLLWVLSVFINAAMQELLCRGYIYQLLKTKYNLPLAVIVTTTMFTLPHVAAFEAGFLAVINIVTVSLFISVLYESEKTIFAPIMVHAIWNIIGGIILGQVRLESDYPSLFNMTSSANTLLSGGEFKIEASIVVTAVTLVLMGFFVYRFKKHKTIGLKLQNL